MKRRLFRDWLEPALSERRSDGASLQPLPVWSHFQHPEIAMPANTTDTNTDNGAKATDFGLTADDRSFDAEGIKATVNDTMRKAERLLQDGIESLRSQSRVYVDAAGEQLGTAQRYVVERVKERPVTATMAGVGVGLLLGLLIAGSRNSNHRHH
jgi:ElaB/YqjD/DUF883 family membrane-anchored ribosome-binding protein